MGFPSAVVAVSPGLNRGAFGGFGGVASLVAVFGRVKPAPNVGEKKPREKPHFLARGTNTERERLEGKSHPGCPRLGVSPSPV